MKKFYVQVQATNQFIVEAHDEDEAWELAMEFARDDGFWKSHSADVEELKTQRDVDVKVAGGASFLHVL